MNIKKNNLDECINKICNFPKILLTNENITPIQVFKEASYEKLYLQITQEQIEKEISSYPDLIDSWMLFAKNKRWSSTWGIEKESNKKIKVYYLNDKGKKTYELIFNNPNNACAYMVKFEMEELRLKQMS